MRQVTNKNTDTTNFRPLKERIMKEGKALENQVLKIDSFMNQQLDPDLFKSMAIEIIKRFSNDKITKIITIESSGIAIATMLGLLLDVQVVIAKKNKPFVPERMLTGSVYSNTRKTNYDIYLSQEFIKPDDHLLFVDDFLANGNVAKGIMELIIQTGASLTGMAFLIEKGFQAGGTILRDVGIKVESLVTIKKLDNGKITFL